VIMRRFRNEMRFFIFENLRRMFFVSRLNTTMFSLIFINYFTKFEIWYCECYWKNVNSNDEKKRKSLLMINEKSWKNRNCDRNQMNVNEKKHFENLDEDFNNDFENASFMNTIFVNLHVIFFSRFNFELFRR
jgi:hypothetical protein